MENFYMAELRCLQIAEFESVLLVKPFNYLLVYIHIIC